MVLVVVVVVPIRRARHRIENGLGGCRLSVCHRTIARLRSLIQDFVGASGGQAAAAAAAVQFLPVHVIELAEDGYIKPHVDSVKFSGGEGGREAGRREGAAVTTAVLLTLHASSCLCLPGWLWGWVRLRGGAFAAVPGHHEAAGREGPVLRHRPAARAQVALCPAATGASCAGTIVLWPLTAQERADLLLP